MTNTALPLGTNGNMTASNVITPFNNSVDGSTLIITGGVISATGKQSGTVVYTNKVVTTGTTYQCLSTDYYVAINLGTPAAMAVTLPSSPTAGQTLVIKDGAGDAATYNITVSPSSGTLDGASNVVLNNNYASVSVFYNGTNWSIS
jgi:hypothetical protein